MKNSNIQWTAHTWNPVWGCRKVSAGCKNCYAERLITGRYGQKFTDVRRTSNRTFNFPYQLHKKLTGNEPLQDRLVFTCSMSDFFIEEADPYRADMWRIIRETPHLVYQILTKRPERIKDHLPDDWGDEGYPNVWLGVSAENYEMLQQRGKLLIRIPAAVRFISLEPMIGRIDAMFFGIDWVIIGGESGNKTGKWQYRMCTSEWIKTAIFISRRAGAAVYVKQFGNYLADAYQLKDKKGGDMEEWPRWARVREWPEVGRRNRKVLSHSL